MDERDAERARFVVSLLVDAMSPTNSLRRQSCGAEALVDTGGASLVRGLENFVGDLARNGGLPAQVDTRKFAVGRNLATTPGSVVYRNPVMELIQYRPTGDAVHRRPLLIAPPQINKFYVFDLVPEKSIVQLALERSACRPSPSAGRIPPPPKATSGSTPMSAAMEEAVDVDARHHRERGRQHLGRLLRRHHHVGLPGEPRGARRTQGPQRHRGGVRARHGGGAEHDGRNLRHAGIDRRGEERLAARRRSRRSGAGAHVRLDAAERPDLELLGEQLPLGNAPPAFDILYWNNDTTRLPARLHADFLDLIGANPYVNAGRLDVRGAPLDMRRVNMDSYVVAGVTDHITSWQGCYKTAKLYGERSTFVLSNSGHIQSLLNPPGNPKTFFLAGAAREATAEGWLERAAKHTGKLVAALARMDQVSLRRDDARRPPRRATRRTRPSATAPGRYVMEK